MCTVRQGSIRYGSVQYGTEVQYDTAGTKTVRQGPIRYGCGQQGWYARVQYGAAVSSTVRQGSIRYGGPVRCGSPVRYGSPKRYGNAFYSVPCYGTDNGTARNRNLHGQSQYGTMNGTIVRYRNQALSYLADVFVARHVDHEKDRLQRPEFVLGEHLPFVFSPVHGRQAAFRSHSPIEGLPQDVVVASQICVSMANGPFRRVEMV